VLSREIREEVMIYEHDDSNGEERERYAIMML
jgi:hypothetical protein